MGYLLRARGLKGELRFKAFNEIESSLKVGKKIWIDLGSGEYVVFLIESLFISDKFSSIKFVECSSRESVENYVGLKFSISRSDFNPIKRDEFYLIDLVGVAVLNEKKSEIGSVIDTMVMPTQNLIVIDIKGTEVLVPFVDEHIMLFDKKKKILILKDVEGLID